jgi:signal transduction histidine kinase
LLIEKHAALEAERERIASEMHDDLGSGLTTIRYISDKGMSRAPDFFEASQYKRIADHSSTLIENMREIIWAMNSRFDNAEDLIGYLRRYALEFLTERNVQVEFRDPGIQDLHQIATQGEKRRTLFLVFKEVLHNLVKHSGATAVTISIALSDKLSIHIQEMDGKGFDQDVEKGRGNGMSNIEKRMQSISGAVAFTRTANGMGVGLSVGLTVPS